MRIAEILSERISLSSYTPTVNRALHTAVANIFKMPTQPPAKMDMQFMVKYNTAFVNAIKPILTDYAKQITNSEVTIQFKSLPNGTGQYIEDTNTITISPKVLSKLITLLYKQFTDKIDVSTELDTIIGYLTSVFLHEVTHATQVSHGQRYKYKRGYIEKDKIKFFTALIQDEFKSEEEKVRAHEIYKSQPDEIAAYAQEAASDLINKIHKLPVAEQATAITVFLKEISKQATTYSDFKNRQEPGYEKVYRRYLKSIYQHLTDYQSSLS